MKKLNLGSGKDIKQGWVNLDSAKLPGVDVVHDIEKLPLPFKDSEFDEILCQDVLEHIEYIPILKDIHRILKMGGKLKIRVPHFTNTLSRMTGTAGFSEMEIADFDIAKEDFQNADYIIGICRKGRLT